MRLYPEEIALANLKGEFPEDERGFMAKEEAYDWLKELSGQDFGDDEKAWEAWVQEKMAERPPKLEQT